MDTDNRPIYTVEDNKTRYIKDHKFNRWFCLIFIFICMGMLGYMVVYWAWFVIPTNTTLSLINVGLWIFLLIALLWGSRMNWLYKIPENTIIELDNTVIKPSDGTVEVKKGFVKIDDGPYRYKIGDKDWIDENSDGSAQIYTKTGCLICGTRPMTFSKEPFEGLNVFKI